MTQSHGQTITDMTRDELQALIISLINERLHGWPFQPQRTGLRTPEAWQMILEGTIEPSVGEPSALDLLREERDQWYKTTS
jgi:hypothetical protein